MIINMFSRKPAETSAPKPRTTIHDGAVQRIRSAFEGEDKSVGSSNEGTDRRRLINRQRAHDCSHTVLISVGNSAEATNPWVEQCDGFLWSPTEKMLSNLAYITVFLPDEFVVTGAIAFSFAGLIV